MERWRFLLLLLLLLPNDKLHAEFLSAPSVFACGCVRICRHTRAARGADLLFTSSYVMMMTMMCNMQVGFSLSLSLALWLVRV
jgi:hypothetical protein